MNGKTLFQATSLGKLTKEENGTRACLNLPQSLNNALQPMRDQLRNMESEQVKTIGKYGTEEKGRSYQLQPGRTCRNGAVEVFALKS